MNDSDVIISYEDDLMSLSDDDMMTSCDDLCYDWAMSW